MSHLAESLLTTSSLQYDINGILIGRSDDISTLGRAVVNVASLFGKKDKMLETVAQLRTDRWERTRRKHPMGEYSVRHDVSPHPVNFL